MLMMFHFLLLNNRMKRNLLMEKDVDDKDIH